MLDHLIRKIGRQQAIEALIKIAYPDFPLAEAPLSRWVVSEGIEPHLFFGIGRKRTYTYRRYVAWYYLKEMGMTYQAIGEMFGGRDHSTIISGIKNHKNYTETKDKQYAQIVQSFNEFFGLGYFFLR